MAAPLVFNILSPEEFSSKNAAIRKPQEIAYFSYDESRVQHFNHSSLRVYYTPPMETSLSIGFESFVKHDENIDEHLDGLLATIVDLERKTGVQQVADVVTWRGMMTKLMCLPFDLRNSFEMDIIKWQNTIYIEENHQYKLKTQRQSSHREKMMSFWGYKFESLATISDSWDDCSRDEIESRTHHVVDNVAQFCSVVKTGLGPVRLLLGGEVDAIWDQKPTNAAIDHDYVELKTSREIVRTRDDIAFERKLLRFWSQSFLLGIPRIIVGFRDDSGILKRVEELSTVSLPSVAKKSGRNLWDGKRCIDCAASILEWLTTNVPDEGVWRLRHEEHSPTLELSKTNRSSFLSAEFVEWRKRDPRQ